MNSTPSLIETVLGFFKNLFRSVNLFGSVMLGFDIKFRPLVKELGNHR